MQDCYAFDVGDFGKLGLLRHIHRVTNLRLGVLWWRTTLETTSSDGKHVAYLQNPAFRACDPDLWEEMRRRFNPGARTIADRRWCAETSVRRGPGHRDGRRGMIST